MLKKILLGLVGLTTMTGCVVVAPRPPVAAYYGPEVVAPVPAPVVVAPVPVPVFGFWGGGYYHGGGYYGRGHWR